jgi:hypothetical protein
VARPRRPQTLGKIERFWGTIWREFLETAVFQDLADARARIGYFIDYYNLQRPHRGLDGLVPADRFFGAAPEVLRSLQERVRGNALELARHGQPKVPFYVTGQIAGQSFSVHAEGERLILRKADQSREEIELAGPTEATPLKEPQAATAEDSPKDGPLPMPVCPNAAPSDRPGEPACEPPLAPGQSVLDEAQLRKQLEAADQHESPQSNVERQEEGGQS